MTRPSLDRTHRCDAHQPGSNACYTIHRCRCYPCATEATAYRRQIERERARGLSRKVDAEPVREHVRSLMASRKGGTDGVGLKQIVKVSGVSQGALWKLMYGAPDRPGPSSWVMRKTAERLMAVSHADMADGATVPAASTWKRIDQMLDGGFAKAEIGRLVHGPQARSLQLSRKRVTVGHARRIAQVHKLWRDGELEPHGKCSRFCQHAPEEVHADV